MAAWLLSPSQPETVNVSTYFVAMHHSSLCQYSLQTYLNISIGYILMCKPVATIKQTNRAWNHCYKFNVFIEMKSKPMNSLQHFWTSYINSVLCISNSTCCYRKRSFTLRQVWAAIRNKAYFRFLDKTTDGSSAALL